MIELGQHAEFIAGAYGFVGVVCLGLVLFAVLRGRAARARLKKLEAEVPTKSRGADTA